MSALMQAAPAATSAATSRLRGFVSGAREVDDAPVQVSGSLPAWLRGTHLLNGPALWELPGGKLQHWFDGYAMWHALRIGDDGVRYRSRFAQSEAFRESMSAQRPVNGEFGSPNPAGLLQRLLGPKVTDNPAVVMSRHGAGAGERWVSVTETPFITYFDPHTLATLERVALGEGDEPMHLMSAHGFTLPDGSYLNVAAKMGPSCELKLFKLRPGQTQPEVIARLKMAKAGYTHGFALAPGHAVLWECALRVQPLSLRFGGQSYAESFRWEPEGGSKLHAVSLDNGAVRSWRIPPMMAFHSTQAYLDGSELVLEVVTYDNGDIFGELMLDKLRAGVGLRVTPRHQRYRLRDGQRDAEPEAIAGAAIELQQVHPGRIGQARARVCWGAGNGEQGEFSDRTLRIDLDSGETRRWQRPNAVQLEPLFVPRPGSSADDDGVLLVPTLADGDAATVIGVIDARSMQCLAELSTPQVVPFGFHAAFKPA